ncbi:MAG: hypothetical protein ACXVCR_02600 [Bdellovibrio sp.]
MFSKFEFTSILFVMALIMGFLSGCDSKVGEQPPPIKNQEFGGSKCLDGIKPTMDAFFNGEAKSQDLEASWDCVSDAIEKFRRYVRGRSADLYTSQELATFLESNFLDQTKNEKISPHLQAEFMKIKQVFVGGSGEQFTRSDIDRLLVVLKTFRQVTVNLNPYIKVLSLKWSVKDEDSHEGDVRFFEKANEEIQSTSRLLASLIEKNGYSYQLSDFVSLTEELSVFFGEQWNFPKTIHKYLPVVKKVKKALAGGDENSIAATEWKRFTLLGSRGYILFLRYYYFIKSVPETGTGYKLSYLSRTVEDLLSVFQDLVAEKPEGVVSRQEVTELLKTLEVVWPDFKISDGLVLELMKMKHLFFGGSTESFATLDFETARLKVSRIKFLIERFLPYYTVYGREWQPELYSAEEAKKLFMEAQFVLEATAREAGSLFEGSYDLKDFANLAAEIEKLYPPEGESRVDKVNAYLPLIIEVKKIFLGGYDSTLKKSNWSVLLSFSARFYTDFLYYDYFIKGKSFYDQKTLVDLSTLSNQSFNIFRDLLSEKKENFVSRVEINKIANELKQLGLIPHNIDADSMDTVIGVVLNNLLVSPERRIDGYIPNALVISSIENLRQEVQVWLDTELFISKITDGWDSHKGFEVKALIELLQRNQVDPDISIPLQTGLRELVLSLNTPVPLTVDEQGRILISNKSEHFYTAKSLRQLNLSRAVSRMLLRSFVTEKGRIEGYTGATLEEFESAFGKLRTFLVQSGLLEPTNTTFGSSRFREANVFTPHSDGNSYASFAELSDLVSMILSGIRIDSMFRNELVHICLHNRGIVSNRETVSLKCLKDVYKDSIPTIMVATPEYVKFVKTMNKDAWGHYFNNLIKAAGYVSNESNTATVEDISLVPHVIQYIEMILARFDKNKDGIISTSDAIRAYPSFKGILMDLAAEQLKDGSIKEEELLDVFTYILRYGAPPESWKDKIKFVMSWKGKRDKWDVQADRAQLAEILGYIAGQGKKTKSKNSSEVFNLRLSVFPDEQKSQSHFEE